MEPITKEELILRCSPEWTQKYTPITGEVRLDQVVEIMSMCAGILLQAMDQRMCDDNKTESISKLPIDSGGDDTHFDYIPCSLRNIENICKLYHYSVEPDPIEDIATEQLLKDEDIYFQEDAFDETEMRIYRKYSEMAGGSWKEYDDMEIECCNEGEEPKIIIPAP